MDVIGASATAAGAASSWLTQAVHQSRRLATRWEDLTTYITE